MGNLQITGGQRIDMFGAKKDDLPDIWEGSEPVLPNNRTSIGISP
jgi:NAD(P)H-nitrite reductase large subunit